MKAFDQDRISTLMNLGGDEFVSNLLVLFVQEGSKNIDAVVASHAHGKYKELNGHAHSLKSSSANLGAKKLSAVAAEIEKNSLAIKSPEDKEKLGKLVTQALCFYEEAAEEARVLQPQFKSRAS